MTLERTWAQKIHHTLLAMLLLLLMLVVIAGGYSGWRQHFWLQINQQANDYHLQSQSHYLLASNELHFLASQLAKQNLDQASQKLNSSGHSASAHIIQREIQLGLDLQHSFKNIKLADISARLLKLKQTFSEHTHAGHAENLIKLQLKELLITLDQIQRLHTATRDELLSDYEHYQALSTQVFYALLIGLMLGGGIIGWRGFSSVGRIIETQQNTEEKIKHQATYDALTNLPNRFLILDRLSQLIFDAKRTGTSIGVVFLDLDDFKKVNDTLGHSTGDKLLIEAGQRIKQCLRQGDSVGRIGGDEFVVLLSGFSNALDINSALEKILKQLQRPLHIDQRELLVTTSIGISVYPDDSHDAEKLLRHADTAMYHSKASGRNMYSYFTDEMNQNIARRVNLEEKMLKALQNNEFEIVYQPQVNLSNGNIIGAEALLRWYNKSLNNPGPDEFIPIAEQSGLIIPIGQFVIEKAFAQCAIWQRQYSIDFRMAVNLSPRQFHDTNLVKNIVSEVNKQGLNIKSIELEITEGVLLSAQEQTTQTLNELIEHDITLSMDDFGTGYSSLSYLRRYPFSILKIDRSFIHDINTDIKDLKLIKATIAMAHNLNLKVIAEGVEDEEHYQMLKDLGCDFAQGYFFGRPMAVSEFNAVLEDKFTSKIKTK